MQSYAVGLFLSFCRSCSSLGVIFDISIIELYDQRQAGQPVRGCNQHKLITYDAEVISVCLDVVCTAAERLGSSSAACGVVFSGPWYRSTRSHATLPLPDKSHIDLPNTFTHMWETCAVNPFCFCVDRNPFVPEPTYAMTQIWRSPSPLLSPGSRTRRNRCRVKA